jgi:hypothetical protein
MTFLLSVISDCVYCESSGAQILGTKSPGSHFVVWRLKFVGFWYGTCCMSSWCLQFQDGSWIFGKFVDSIVN